MDKKKFFIRLSYNGTKYHGWQVQPNADTIQEELNRALSTLFREPIETVGTGRTDTGVHAKNYIAHFSVRNIDIRQKKQVIYKLNRILPGDIVIHDLKAMHEDAHARFDALSRKYVYVISTVKQVFSDDLCWQFSQPLDVELMRQASNMLLDIDDFTSFSKLHTDVKTNVCNVTYIRWLRSTNRLIFIIEADRFLRNMVRAIVGTMVDVGRGKLSISEFENIIKLKDRGKAGPSAPASGLFFYGAEYPYEV
ncbi:MAG: tRNA pseudouridine(38-40) synthase TruA [Bacteroidales bacterium]|nr:tRNA pseudouridine(38-40) synthase TruA [Bacteroidales bacterium]